MRRRAVWQVSPGSSRSYPRRAPSTNPGQVSISYGVDALRTLMVTGYTSAVGLGSDFAVMILVTALLVGLGARFYPRLIQ